MKIVQFKSNDGEHIINVLCFTEEEIESLCAHGPKIREQQKAEREKKKKKIIKTVVFIFLVAFLVVFWIFA